MSTELSPFDAKMAEARARVDLLQELAAAVFEMAPPDTQRKLAPKCEAWIAAVQALDEATERERKRWLAAPGAWVNAEELAKRCEQAARGLDRMAGRLGEPGALDMFAQDAMGEAAKLHAQTFREIAEELRRG